MKILCILLTTFGLNIALQDGGDQLCLQDFYFVSAFKKDCDTYKVYYSEDFKIKSFTGNLYEIQKLGIDVDEVIYYVYKQREVLKAK